MSGPRRLLVAAVLVAAIAAGCGSTETPPGEQASSASIHQPVPIDDAIPAPALAGPDPITGRTHRLADYQGSPVVLNFWASWCGPCRQELPDLQRFADANPDVVVLGVNLDDVPADAKALQRELGFDFPSIAIGADELSPDFDLLGMPTTFFLDPDHRLRARVLSVTDEAGFAAGVDLAMGKAG